MTGIKLRSHRSATSRSRLATQGPRQPTPALEWSGMPHEAVERAAICEDPDTLRHLYSRVPAGMEPIEPGASRVAGRQACFTLAVVWPWLAA
jgi:hypothetical protein